MVGKMLAAVVATPVVVAEAEPDSCSRVGCTSARKILFGEINELRIFIGDALIPSGG